MATKFIETDYATNVAAVQAKVATKGTWIDLYESATGQMFIELPIAASEQLLYYIQRRCEEVYIPKLKNKSSAVNLTRLLNYDVSRVISSRGTLRFSIAATRATTVLIPKYTKCTTSDGTKYVTTSESAINPGSLFVDVSAMQGEKATVSAVSDGSADQSVSISDADVENDSIVVTVDGITWTEYDAFLVMNDLVTGYVVRVNNDDTLNIIFGDGITGVKPPSSATILVTYIKSIGAAGNAAVGSVSTIADALYDNAGNQVTVTVSNTTKMLGGQDSEGVEEIRYNAPRVFKTGDRMVNRADYISFLKKYSGVVSANAWGEKEEGTPVVANFNKAFISLMLEEWELADAAFKTQITNDLFVAKGMMTVYYEFVDPTVIEIFVDDFAVVSSAKSLSAMQTSIETSLDTLFHLGVTAVTGIDGETQDVGVDIGSPIYQSNVVKTIDSIEGVRYHALTLNGYQTVGTGNASTTSFSSTLYLTDITKSTVFIYVNEVLVGHDDGSGIITPDTVALSSGSINYESGLLSLTFATAPVAAADIRCKYKPLYSASAPHDLIPAKNQILKLVKKNVVTSYT